MGAIWLGILSHIHDARDPSVATQLAQQEKEESEFFHAPFEPYLASSHSATVAPAVLSALSAQGKTIFDSHGCNGCHGENGMGGAIDPALTQVGAKFADTQLIEVMRNPTAKMRAGKMMPVNLDVTSMTALSSYLKSCWALLELLPLRPLQSRRRILLRRAPPPLLQHRRRIRRFRAKQSPVRLL